MKSIISHGSNKDCPSVIAGDTTHCPGHLESEFDTRSSGPMATTVDKVLAEKNLDELFATTIGVLKTAFQAQLDAALHRACEKAAMQIGKMVEADNFLHIKTTANEIEHHVRQELGL